MLLAMRRASSSVTALAIPCIALIGVAVDRCKGLSVRVHNLEAAV